jgi:MFS family permease
MSRPDLSTLAEVVPQIGYDIIGRIIPGVIVIFGLIIAILGPTQALAVIDAWVIHPDPPLSGWAVVLVIIAGYALAVILAGIWYILKPLFRSGKKKNQDADKEYRPDPENPPFSLQYNAIREKSPKAGARIVKLSAETTLGRVLAVGWSFCAIINVYFLIAGFSLARLWLEVAFIVGIVAASSFRNHIADLQTKSVKDHWLILHCDQWLRSTQPSSAASEGSADRPSAET